MRLSSRRYFARAYAAAALRRKRRAQYPRGVDDPGAVTRQRRDAGQPAATVPEFRPGRPAHHANDDDAAVLVAEHRRAGIAGAGAQPGAVAFGLRIEQANLQ